MELIDLSSGASYFQSPDSATAAAILALKQGKTKYGPTEGALLVRTAIADRYKKEGISLTPAQILITPVQTSLHPTKYCPGRLYIP